MRGTGLIFPASAGRIAFIAKAFSGGKMAASQFGLVLLSSTLDDRPGSEATFNS
jgi:hypothetical protein